MRKADLNDRSAALQPQELSSDEDSDQEMEEINPELSLSNQLSDEPLPPPRDISKPNSRHSRTSVTVDPNTIQKPAPPKTTARPLARRTPQQATLSAQAKLRNNTSFGEFTGISSPGTPDCQIQPSGSVSEDGSGDPEQPLDQGPSIISSALQLESDSEGELEEVQTERRGEVFTLPIQQPVEASSVQEHSHDPSPTDMSELHQTATQSSAFDILLQPTATGIPATKAASFSNEQTSAQPSRPQPSRSPKTVIPVEKHEKQAETLLDEDSDAVEDWSRSPSPAGRAEHQAKANEPPAMSSQEVHAPDYVPPDFPLAPEGKELDSDGDLDAGDLEEAELTANIRAEEGHFTKFLRDLQHRNLTNMRSEVDAEVAQLEQARKTDRRNADEITTQMSKEIMVGLAFW